MCFYFYLLSAIINCRVSFILPGKKNLNKPINSSITYYYEKNNVVGNRSRFYACSRIHVYQSACKRSNY